MRYKAFLSYSRADDKVANWLHHQLDAYRTPKQIVGTNGEGGSVPDRLHPIFRDRTDMSGGGQLSYRIEQELADSEFLIVLCSPAAANSAWVDREVQVFTDHGRGDKIFPVISAECTETDDPERDFFPPSLRGRGLLAADLREIKTPSGRLVGDGKEGGRLKLLAGLLGVPLDALAQRERARQRRLLGAAIAAAATFALVAGAAIVLGFVAQMNAVRAETALKRLLIPTAWTSLDDGDAQQAVKFALAAGRLLPSQQGEARDVLLRALFDLRDSVALQQVGAYLSSFTPDGQRIVTGSGGGTLEIEDQQAGLAIWNATDGSRLQILEPFGLQIRGIGVSDSRIVAALSDGSVKSYGYDGAAQLVGRHEGVVMVRVSDDGAFGASADNDGTFRVWDLARGRLLRELRTDRSILDLAFSSDSRFLAVSFDRRNASEFEGRGGVLVGVTPDPTQVEIYAVSQEGVDLVQSFDLSPFASDSLVTRTFAGNLLMHEARSPRQLIWSGARANHADLASNQRGGLFPMSNGALSVDGGVRMLSSQQLSFEDSRWSPESAVTASSAVALERSTSIRAAFAQFGGLVSVHEISWWNRLRHYEAFRFRHSNDLVTSIHLSQDGDRLVASSITNTRLLSSFDWPLEEWLDPEYADFARPLFLSNGYLVSSVIRAESDPMRSALGAIYAERSVTTPLVYLRGGEQHESALSFAASPNDVFVAAVTDENRIYVWTREGRLVGSVERLSTDQGFVIAVGNDGLVYQAGAGGIVYASNATTGQSRPIETANNPDSRILMIASSPSGNSLALTTTTGVRILDLESGRSTVLDVQALSGPALAVAYSPDGRRLAVSGLVAQRIVLLDAQTGAQIQQISGADVYMGLAFAGLDYVIGIGAQGSFEIWGVATGRTLLQRRLRDSDGPVGIAMSSDGTAVVAFDDDMARLNLSLLLSDFEEISARVCQRTFNAAQISTFSEDEINANPILSELVDNEFQLCEVA